MSKRAIIYARVSTEEQGKGYSLTTQIESCRRYATEQGHTVVAEFTDMYSGTELDRPGLAELYRFVEGHTADLVIVHDIDRLSREVSNQAIIEMELSRAGIKLDYVLGQYADTPEGELLKLVKSGIAQYENRQRVERSRRGKRGRAEAGYVIMPNSRAPFGYDYISEKHKGWLVINEEQAAIVKLIYHWLVDEGISSYAIARRLFDQGILTKGDFSPVVYKKLSPAAWSPSTIRRIISNPVYKGTWYYGKTRSEKVGGKTVKRQAPESEWVGVAVPAIIDEATWRQAQACLKRNKELSKRNTKHEYLLRSLIFCPCGRRWMGRYKKPQGLSYYRCPSNEGEHWRSSCPNRFSIRKEILEHGVWNKITELILQPGHLARAIERHRSHVQADMDRLQQRLAAIDAAIADLDRKTTILLDEILTGTFSRAVINAKKKQLDEQRHDLTAEAERIRDTMTTTSVTPDQEAALMEFVQQIGEALDDLNFERKRRVLEILRTRVDVISRTQVRLSGVLSAEGLTVELTPA